MAVTEAETGTMAEAEKRAEASLAEQAKTPASKEQVSPEDELKYSQKQLDDFIHQANSEAGRRRVVVEQERDTLKSQIQTKESELGDIQAERDSLQTQIEGLIENDPKKYDLVKQDKQLRERERKYKENLRALETRETSVNARVERADAFEAEVLMETIADEYEDGDKARLKTLCDSLGAKNEEQIRTVAKTLYSMSQPKGTQPPLKRVSGITAGGGGGGRKPTFEELQGATPEEYANKVKSGEWVIF